LLLGFRVVTNEFLSKLLLKKHFYWGLTGGRWDGPSLKRKKNWYGNGGTPGIFGLKIRGGEERLGGAVRAVVLWVEGVGGGWLGLMEVRGREVGGFGVWQSLRKKV
jgi:hypothetical protein